ncbi:hypothetical protein B0H21DRAFT_708591 [Amylocystis lapponica]|nr:hypothetical protein B0H21DRAFT_708591 [Amylocystis lapponica]
MSNISAEELQRAYIYVGEIWHYCFFASFGIGSRHQCAVLYAYDYFLTFSREVELIWKRKFTGVTVLFILNRYAWMLGRLLDTFPLTGSSLVVYKFLLHWHFHWNMADSIYRVFSALRIYAIWNGEWRPTLLVLSLGFIQFGIVMCISTPKWVGSYSRPSPGCVIYRNMFPYSHEVQCKVTFLSFTLLIIAKCFCVLILTWMRTYGIHKHASKAHIKASIATLILRDGTIIWGIMFMLGLANIVCYDLDILYPVQSFTPTLREVYLSGTGDGTSRAVESTHLSFASNIVGVMGAPLDHDEWRDSHIDADEDPQPPLKSDNPLAAGLWEADTDLDGAGENAYEMDAITRAADANEVDGDAV